MLGRSSPHLRVALNARLHVRCDLKKCSALAAICAALLAAGFVQVTICSAADASNAGRARTPAVRSAERRALINAIRPACERDLGQKVIFNVERLSVIDEVVEASPQTNEVKREAWCFARVVPIRARGAAINYRKTKYREAIESAAFKPVGEALLEKKDGRWKLLEWRFGATGSALESWVERYHAPALLLQGPSATAVAAATPATTSGRTDAGTDQVELARKYFEGDGVPKDPARGVKIAEEAASRGNAAAQFLLGEAYHEGWIGGGRDPGKAVRWWSKAAAQGNAAAEFQIAKAYGSGNGVAKSDAQFFKWSKRAAEHGNAQAQAVLAGAYLHGEGVKKNPAKGVELAEKSAAQGNPAGQYFLGLAHYKGVTPEGKNPARAFSLFLQAAQQKDNAAEWMISQAYAKGEGVSNNRVEAVRWARQSAEHGYPDAQAFLGIAYATGDGVPPDRAEAVNWLTKAAALGNEGARAYLKKMSVEAANLNPEQPPASPGDFTEEEGAAQWKQYADERLGFVLQYPPSLVPGEQSKDADEYQLQTPEGEFVLEVVRQTAKGGGRESLERQLRKELKLLGATVTYRRKAPTWFVLSGVTKDGTEYYRKLYSRGGKWVALRMTYPHAKNNKYDAWVTRIEKSFRPFADANTSHR